MAKLWARAIELERAVVEKLPMRRELDDGAEMRERRGDGRLDEISATGRFLGIQLLLVMPLWKQMSACNHEGSRKRSMGSHQR